MSDSHSTPPAVPDKPAKPSKPSPDFPLFPHATRRWAKKIKGEMHYFGRWDDPEGALQEYQAFVVGKTVVKARLQRVQGRPAKPSPDFPLFPHAAGVWAKKIRGKMHYFGPWDDPDGALKKYLDQKDDLHAGRKPRPDVQALTVKDVVNAFRNSKTKLQEAGELSPRTWADYKRVCDLLVAHFGRQRIVSDLHPEDFAELRNKAAKKWGPHRLATTIQYARSVFKYAFEEELIPTPVRFGRGFKRPTKKTMRLHRAKQGPKLFTAEEVRKLITAAKMPMKAMLLLGINAAFGNADCGNLPLTALDLERGFIDFPRPKTGCPRRCPLWPETVQALKEALAKRPKPKEEEHGELVFITKYGDTWGKDTSENPISREVGKLLKKAEINGRKGIGFYTLRHVFRTIADEVKDQPAADYIMGYEIPNMSSVYRETISDARLKAVSDHVRAWLFPPAKGGNV
jgi:integrase